MYMTLYSHCTSNFSNFGSDMFPLVGLESLDRHVDLLDYMALCIYKYIDIHLKLTIGKPNHGDYLTASGCACAHFEATTPKNNALSSMLQTLTF